MQQRLITPIQTTIIVLLMLHILIAPTQSQEQAPRGVDIIFLVDQSGSMGGEAYGTPERTPTDPLDLRFSSVQFAVDLLGSYRQAIGADLDMRMAVVSFGSSAEISLNWTEIAPESDINWETTSQQLQSQLSADTFRNSFPPGNLGVTDFVAAFNRADQLFDSLPNTDNERIIILITDGAPCVNSGLNAFVCGNEAGEQNHMIQLLNLSEAEFNADNYAIYVIALDSTNTFWQSRNQDWNNIVGDPDRATQVETGTQIAVRIQSILTEIVANIRNDTSFTPPQSLLTDSVDSSNSTNNTGSATFEVQTIFVTPFQSQMRLTFFKSQNAPIEVAITTPDGILLTQNSPNVSVQNINEPIELWIITDPAPGNWTINILSQNNLIDAYWQLQPMTLELNTSPLSADLFEIASITTQITRADSLPLPNYTESYGLNVNASIQQANGDISNVLLAPFGANSYTGTFPVNQVGIYDITLETTTQALDGTILVLAQETQTLTIGDFIFEANDFPSGQYLEGEQITGSLTLIQEDGNPLDLPNLRVVAILEDDSNTVITEEILTFDAATSTYPYTLDLLTIGTYQIRLRATSQPDNLDEQTIGTTVSPRITVIPSTQIQLSLIDPTPATTIYSTTGFPAFQSTPLDVIFETVASDNNTRLDIRTLNSTTPIEFTISMEQNEEVVATTSTVNLSAEVLYQISFDDLPTGDYQLIIDVSEGISGQYILLNDGRLTATLTIASHPHILIFRVTIGALITLIILIIALLFYLRRRSQQHPLQGKLILERQQGFDEPTVVKEINLKTYNRNRVKLSPKGLGLRRTDMIKSITFISRDELMSKGKQVNLDIKMKSGKSIDARISPGETITINSEQSYTGDGDAEPVYFLRAPFEDGFSSNDDIYF